MNTDFNHRPYCPTPTAPLRRWRGRLGDAMETCSGCGMAALVEPVVALVAIEPPETITRVVEALTSPPLAARYVCATHDTPVSWHGRDCPECRAEHADREARARARHAAVTR